YDIQYVANRIFTGGSSWHLTGSPVRDRAQLEKIATVVEEVLWQYVSRNQLPLELFEWFVGTRSGSGWQATKLGERIGEKIITGKLLHTHPYFYASDSTGKRPFESATCGYMWLVRSHFRGLAEKYPVARYFDDMFVEEATRTGYLDSSYWSRGGLDEEKKIVGCAAKLIAGYQTLPIGYGQTMVYPISGKSPFRVGQIVHLPGSAAAIRPADSQRLAPPAPRSYSSGQFFDWQHRALAAPAEQRDAMITAVERRWNKTRFDIYAAGRSYFRTPASEMPTGNLPADIETRAAWRKMFFQRTASYVTNLKTLPRRYSPPYLISLTKIDPDTITVEELDVLLSFFPGATPPQWPSGWGFDAMATCIQRGLTNLRRGSELIPIAPELWRITRRSTGVPNFVRSQVAFANMLTEQAELYGSELALVYASAGVEVMKSSLSVNDRVQLAALRNINLSNIGGVIPVKKSDPRYPIFAAQAAFLTGRTKASWNLYLKNRELVATTHRDLDPSFSLWLIDRNVVTEDFESATKIAQDMLVWFDSVPAGFDPEIRARLMLSYAKIALAQREYPRARAQCSRIVAAREFNGTRSQAEAELMVANVDRLQGRYDSAIDLIEKILDRDDPAIQAEAYLHLALVKFDQEEFKESRDLLAKVFQRDPEHTASRILEGRVNLALKKLEEAVELEIGTVALQRLIMPGKPLKVRLEDKNLVVVGKSTDIEIRAWTDSGDEEHFSLLPYGDSKTKFRGQIDTQLAAPKKEDGVLQLLGVDRVHYDFSERFKKQQQINFDKPAALSVATDGALFASSGTIRTPQELEAQALEDLIRARVGDAPGAPAKLIAPLNERRPENQVKPGNRINLRVVDPDHSATAGVDKLEVRVKARSGDRIEKFVLTETGEYTGVFEGSVETKPGQPVAQATDSQEDRDPNFCISPKEYPPWIAISDGQRPKHFSVDLNDNVSLGIMKVQANVPGHKLKAFDVQLSINGKTFHTVGRWPKAFQPWDGSLRLEVVCAPTMTEMPKTLGIVQGYLNTGHITDDTAKVRQPIDDMGWTFEDVKTRAFFPRTPTDPNRTQFDQTQIYLAHYQAAFYQNVRRLRTIRVAPKNADDGNVFFLSIDGQPATDGTFKMSLAKGVHTIDVHFAAKKGTQPDFELIWDTLEEPFEKAIPAETYSLAKFPQIRDAIYTPPAEVTANEAGTEFEIAFDKNAQARVVRLMISDFELGSPGINKITLTDRADVAVLPTKQDFRDLWANDLLEIISGDQVTITYRDPRVITPGNDVHEQSLTATYHNGAVGAAFGEYILSGSGNRTVVYVPMRRFKPGDVIHVQVNDPDMDTSDKLDTVDFSAKTYGGKPVTLTAVETGPHTGLFIGRVFPVEREPKRESEVRVTEDDEVSVSYLDRENTDPGVPWLRTASVEQVWWKEPEIRVYEVTSRQLNEQELQTLAENTNDEESLTEEIVPIRATLTGVRPETPNLEEPAQQTIGVPLMVELLFPYIAQSAASRAEIYVQTKHGRKAHDRDVKPTDFDITVPGTIKLSAGPSSASPGQPPRGYDKIVMRTDPYAVTPLDDGRFTIHVPLVLGDTPPDSYAVEEDNASLPLDSPDRHVLKIKGDDEIFIAFKYKNELGQEKWLQRSVKLASDAFFDVMDRRFQQPVVGLFVGQNAYFRVIHPSMDLTDDKDVVDIELKTTSGKTKKIELIETYSHSGIFKGIIHLVYDGDKTLSEEALAAAMPVTYGDQVTITYADSLTGSKFEHQIEVFKGSDGKVLPFTKRFNDPEIAVQTQFTIAESYFELAKRHRQLGQQEIARREIEQGKKLLEEALRDYPETKAKVQADYLLANLSLEFAKDTKDEGAARKLYIEAVGRFSDIVATYSESPYAPKSQYKKAQALEKMGDIDLACEEYVKLSYRYPNHELIAETIAALGTYFSNKGLVMKKEATATEDAVEAEKIILQSKEMFQTAAEVFGRLGERFPDHNLSTLTTVRSAQCYMRAEMWDEAVDTFQHVLDDKDADKDLRAEAMYWCADSYMRMKESISAYRVFKPLTWEYPESKWAKYARGRLASDSKLSAIDAAGGETPQ
ncbi:MAG: tetratricopeptide repeat protein, partial [Planctomycetes bacterium]|nr:tetratricopeptide repeat protein [Planctomycetota bacterium]